MSVLIDWKKLRGRIPWSRAHIQRLEDAGKFPRRVRMGQGRVAWIEREIDEYIDQLIRERDTTHDNVSDSSDED